MFLRIFNLQVRLPLLLLALLEGTVLALAPHVVTWLGIGTLGDEVGTSSRSILAGSVIFAVVGLVSLMAVGLYSTRQRISKSGTVARVAVAILNSVVLSALVYYFLPYVGIGRRTLFMAACISVVLIVDEPEPFA